MTSVVMDLGGTRLKVGVARDGDVLRTKVYDVPPGGGRDALLDLLTMGGRALLAATDADSAGLCVPGLVQDGVLVSLPGKLAGLEGADLALFLRETFDVQRVEVTNDALAHAMGEATAGAGRGCRRVVVVTIGTGVGVSVIEDGRPATSGMFGSGILGGFIPITDGAPGEADSIGRTDTIEAACAAGRITSLTGYPTVPGAYEGFERGEIAARNGIALYRERLARALVALAHAHAPERLILGGGPMLAGNPIVAGLEAMVNERLYGTYRVDVRTAELGDGSPLAGLAHRLTTNP